MSDIPERTVNLTKARRRALDLALARSALHFVSSADPIRQKLEKVLADAAQGLPPDLPSRLVFPSIALRLASKRAKEFSDAYRSAQERAKSGKQSRAAEAAEGLEASRVDRREESIAPLRQITLRLCSPRSGDASLEAQWESLTSPLGSALDYLIKADMAYPQVSVVHIKIVGDTESSSYDPHIHGLWEIEPAKDDRVRKYFEKLGYDLWIDKNSVKSPQKAFFYLHAGLINYEAFDWLPSAAIEELWRLPTKRFVRLAGWYAHLSELARHNARARRSGAFDSVEVVKRAHTPKSEASVSQQAVPDKETVLEEHEHELYAHRSHRNNSFETPAQALIKHTVHPAIQETPQTRDPRHAPTIDELSFVVDLLRIRTFNPAQSFNDWCRRSRTTEVQGLKASRRVEAYFRTPLFFPGPSVNPDWRPTKEGIRFIAPSLAIVEPLFALWEEVSKPARSNESPSPENRTFSRNEAQDFQSQEASISSGQSELLPENMAYDLRASATLDELIFVIDLLWKRAHFPASRFGEICREQWMTEEHGKEAVRRVQDNFRVKLFFPALHWDPQLTPTAEGITFLERSMDIANRLFELWDEFSLPARSAEASRAN